MGRLHAAAPHHRNPAGPGYLINHPHGHREDRRTGKSAHYVGDDRLAAFHVDPHAQHRIDQADAVGTGLLARPGDRHDVRHVRTEFDIDRFGGHGFHGTRHLGRRFGRRAEAHAAVPHVGTAYIDLDQTDLFLLVDPLAAIGIFLDRKTADVGDHRLAEECLQPGKLFADHRIDTGILQPDGIDHPRRTLGDAGRGVAEACLARSSLEGKRPKDVDVVKILVLVAVTERTAGRHDWIIQPKAAQRHRRIEVFLGFVYHIISSFFSTGPSLQMRLAPFFV